MKNLTIIILAAGKGTRMNSSVPKVFHPLGGIPLIEHTLNSAKKLNPKEIFLILNKDISKEDFKREKLVRCFYQKRQLGTADAVKTCLVKLKNSKNIILVMYADHPFIESKTLRKVVNLKSPKEIKLLVFKKEEHNSYGKVILGTDGFVKEIIEQRELSLKDRYVLCNSGVFCGNAKILSKLLPKIKNNNKKKEFYLTDIFKIASQNNYYTSTVLREESEIMGINDKKELAEAEKILQANLRNRFLKKGVSMKDPDTVYLSADTKIGKDVTIYPHVFIGDKVVIASGTRIYSFSHLENCKIGKNSSIGPYARLRPGADISDGAKVGNFVEIKNSTVGKDSKVNHLTYIGDAEIGKNVNVGAGTITCNYDGKKKHKTVIEDDAFIGSNSSIIAPVKIGKKSYIGSGSAISKDVKANSLAVERSTQMEIKNWLKKVKK
jgi:bifunctional UDP-N-acetylglucosamine pyrophosphorylase/glucosamine-1-phosphate N-acetyltransferase